MMDNKKETIENNKLQNNYNSPSDPYKRNNNDNYPSEKRDNKNILKNIGEELIINSKNTLTNKHSYKSIFSPRNINNRKLKKIYDPYLISVCKKAIIREKKQLPNYKEIIRNINTEFGIEETEKQNFDYFPKNKNQLTINNETSNTR